LQWNIGIAAGIQVGAAMVHHHALRVARGARGVGERDRCPFVARWLDGKPGIAGGEEILVGRGFDRRAGDTVIHNHHLWRVGHARQRVGRDGGEFAVQQQQLRARMAEDEAHRRRIQPGVDRAQHRMGHGHAHMRFQHRGDVGQQHRDDIAGRDPRPAERRGEAPAAFRMLGIGDPPLAMDDRHAARPDAGGARQEGDG
jgi:hypothetical protein